MNKTENDYSIFVRFIFPRYVKKLCTEIEVADTKYRCEELMDLRHSLTCPEEEKFFIAHREVV